MMDGRLFVNKAVNRKYIYPIGTILTDSGEFTFKKQTLEEGPKDVAVHSSPAMHTDEISLLSAK